MNGERLPAYRTSVAEEWIDYNGHMSEAYYVLVFGFATDQVMESLGMDAAYRSSAAASLYTVEAHIRYLQETSLGDELSVETRIVGSGAKKLHLAHEMFVRSGSASGALVATEELLALHLNTDTGRTEAFPEAVVDTVGLYAPVGGVEPPEWVGRRIAIES